MNEFTAKKLAEVEAFLQTAGVIAERAGESLRQQSPEVATGLTEASRLSVASAVPSEQQQVFTDKVAKTSDKLTQMMELYIGDAWDNPVEVLEWSSFFSGAAAAHAALVGELDPEIKQLLSDIQEHFEGLLQQVIAALQAVGRQRVNQ